ncbi:MAG: preprotein translocase subunit SecY [Candidatus Binatia bacterium]
MLSGFQNASRVPELRRRVLFALGMLAVYRLGVHVPTPGIDRAAMAAFFDQQKNTLFGFLNLFSGGALEQFSVFSLGIMPYISASIILQLLTVVFPYLERLSKEGEVGRRKITQYTRYGTVLLSIVQGTMIAIGLEGTQGPGGTPLVLNPGVAFRFMTVVTLTSGTAFIMWLGEQITERGIGNGMSLIIFAGIVARLPSAIWSTFEFMRNGELGPLVALVILVLSVAIIAAIIFVERGQRRIPVQYAKRVVGRRMYGGMTSHLPLKVNTANVIPIIFASSVLIFPATMAQFAAHPWIQTISGMLAPGQWLYEIAQMALIIFFAFFYTAVVFNPSDVAENMKKAGGYIPGIRPGQKTAEFIEKVLSRITLSGAVYLCLIALLPSLLVQQFNVPFYFGGTALLIVVGVGLDTVAQMETHLISRNYEGFMKRGRLRGRKG